MCSSPQLKAQGGSSDLIINEVLAVNDTAFTRLQNFAGPPAVTRSSNPDIIELRNLSAQAIDLSGYSLSDDPSNPARWTIADGVSIPANGFIVIFATGEGDFSIGDTTLETNFRLSAGGETIVLSDPSGALIQELDYPQQIVDISYGRLNDGTYAFLPNVTVGAANDESGAVANQVRRPRTDQESGLFSTSESVVVTLTSEPGTVIRFTTDGTQPTASSPVYSAPLSFTETTVLKSIAIETATGVISDIASRSFIFTDVQHDLPVVIITPDNFEIIDINGSIYSRFELVGRVRLDFLETDGSLPISQYGDYSRSGNVSSSLPFFNGEINATSRFGPSRLDHNFFPEKDEDSYERILIRGAGQDIGGLRLRDAIVSRIISEDELVEAEHEGFRPAVAYVNGLYAGHMNVRENDDPAFARQYFDLPEPFQDFADSVSISRGTMSAPYRRFVDLPNRNAPDAIVRLNELVRINEAMLDAAIRDAFQVFEESIYWASSVPGQQERYSLHDYDFAFGLRRIPLNVWGELTWAPRDNFPMDGENTRFWHDALQSAASFLHLFAYPERLRRIINSTADEIRSEIPRTAAVFESRRIDGGVNTGNGVVVENLAEWEGERQSILDYIDIRFTGAIDAMATTYGMNVVETDIRSNDPSMGQVAAHGYKISPGRENGRYFEGLPLRLQATAEPGFTFDSWTGDIPAGADPNNPYIEVAPAAAAAIVANFTPSTFTLAVSEIHYNPVGPSEADEFIEVVNFGADEIDLSGISFSDGIEYTFPDGTTLAAGAYLTVTSAQYTGSLNNDGEMIALSNSSGEVFEFFEYNDSPEWPQNADGNGPSLVRIAPGNDDPNLPSSWRASLSDGGNPDASDALPLTDTSREGLLTYAFGTDSPSISIERNPDGSLSVDYDRIINADAVEITLESSTTLEDGSWNSVSTQTSSSASSPAGLINIAAIQSNFTDETLFFRLQVTTR